MLLEFEAALYKYKRNSAYGNTAVFGDSKDQD